MFNTRISFFLFNVFITTCQIPIALSKFPSNFPFSHEPKYYPYSWISQTLDHLTSDTRTFKQRYMVNDDYYQPGNGGPAVLLVGGEEELDGEWMTSGGPIGYAITFGGILFQLEHRYYGKSLPSQDEDVSSLRYLSSIQAVMDIAFFIARMNEKYNMTGTPWITCGGSYSGSLAMWARAKYPYLITGAIAASAPVYALVDFYDLFYITEKSIRTHSDECANKIRDAIQQISDSIRTGSQRRIESLFVLDESINAVVKDQKKLSDFYSAIAQIFAVAVQYNDDNTDDSFSINGLCRRMKTSGGLMENLARIYNDFYSKKPVDDGKIWSDDVLWLYQTCTEFGWMQTTSELKPTIFGQHIPLKHLIEDCTQVFGSKYDVDFIRYTVANTNAIFGGYALVNVTNVISIHGSLDPWYVLGIYNDLNPSFFGMLLEGESHCSVLKKENDFDSEELQNARQKINQIITSWINL